MPITHPTGIEITVEVLWDVPTWTDITADVRFMQLETANRSRLQNTFDPGRLVLTLDNSSRKYDPMFSSGPYFGKLRPGKFVRVLFDSPSATPSKYAFVGETASFDLNYDQSNRDGTTQLVCSDVLTRASQLSVLAGDTPALVAGEDADNRLGHIFASAGALLTATATGGEYASYYSATFSDEWDPTSSYNVLDEIRRVGDVEQGPVFPDYVNYPGVVSHTRHWFKWRPRSASVQASFGPGNLPFSQIQPLYDTQEIVTAVSMSDENGNTVQNIDATAIVDYGWRAPFATYNNLPSETLGVLAGAASAVVVLRSSPEFRVDELVIKPGAHSSFRQYVPELTLLDRVSVSFTPTGISPAISGQYFIDGITHAVSPGDWTTTYSLWPAAPFDAAIPGDLFIVGSSPLGGSDQLGI